MKERPIIFTGESIRAILEGRKSQTRRVIKPTKQTEWLLCNSWSDDYIKDPRNELVSHCPFGQVGDRLWVRETYCLVGYPDKPDIEYKADGVDFGVGWKPSIFMPRWASRITLEITGVRVERVQEIGSWDCIYEGIAQKYNSGRYFELYGMATDKPNHILIEEYQELWDSLNAKRGYGWEANPWVWVISFRRV